MHIASLTERITIERLTSTKDNRGNARQVWDTYLSLRAAANIPRGSEVYTRHEYETSRSGYEGNEYYSARQTLLENKMKFTVRYHPKLKEIDTEHDRIVYNDRIYNILSSDPITDKNKLVTITAICKDGNDNVGQ